MKNPEKIFPSKYTLIIDNGDRSYRYTMGSVRGFSQSVIENETGKTVSHSENPILQEQSKDGLKDNYYIQSDRGDKKEIPFVGELVIADLNKEDYQDYDDSFSNTLTKNSFVLLNKNLDVVYKGDKKVDRIGWYSFDNNIGNKEALISLLEEYGPSSLAFADIMLFDDEKFLNSVSASLKSRTAKLEPEQAKTEIEQMKNLIEQVKVEIQEKKSKASYNYFGK